MRVCIFFLAFAAGSLMGSQTRKVCQKHPSLEIKGGYFFFSDPKMRKVYDHGGFDLQFSGTYPIWRWFQFYGSVEYLERSGASLNGGNQTKIWILPLSAGIQSLFRMHRRLQYYVTLGPRYFFVHAHTRASDLDRNLSQSGFGGFLNTGFRFFPVAHLFFDGFGEYSYQKVHFHASKTNVYGQTTQIGGFAFSAGFGYYF